MTFVVVMLSTHRDVAMPMPVAAFPAAELAAAFVGEQVLRDLADASMQSVPAAALFPTMPAYFVWPVEAPRD